MSVNRHLRCPVCGSEKKVLPLSEFDCEKCNFTNAYIRYFSSEEGKILWTKKVEDARADWMTQKRVNFALKNQLVIGSNLIAFCDGEQKKVHIALGTGKLQVETNALQFDSSERNYAVLYDNGCVAVFGEGIGFGQKNVETWTKIQHILMASNCTYGIDQEGGVVYAGAQVALNVSAWKRIKKLRTGPQFLVGLDSDGKVCFAGDFASGVNIGLLSAWESITDIGVSRDCIVGLCSDGTVKVLGKDSDSRKRAEAWTDIIAIATDNAYVYGLTKDGKIKIAGWCTEFFDQGRSKAVEWTKVVSIACNTSGIGAITEAGDLLFAGSIAGDLYRMNATWNKSIKPAITY